MPKSAEARSSAIQYDGAMLFAVNSPVMSLSAAASNQGSFVVPCACEIEEIICNLVAVPNTTPATLNIGTRADADALVDAYSIPITATAGAFTIPLTNAAVVATKLNKGDVLEFSTGGEAASAGSVGVTLVLKPSAAD